MTKKQKTPKGHEIPVPAREDFLADLKKAAKPKADEDRRALNMFVNGILRQSRRNFNYAVSACSAVSLEVVFETSQRAALGCT